MSSGVDTRPAGARTVERELEIDAPVGAVWRALTEARELERWFPLEASVTPGPGGVMRLSWGEWYDGESEIQIWEPERHLRHAFPRFGEDPVIATDYWLEGRGGRTFLRVVSSGFGPDADWDEAYEGVSRGWDFELLGLRHYLERHRGRDRAVAFAVERHTLPVAEAWRRLTGPGGWLGEPGLAGIGKGDAYSVRTATGETLSGRALLVQPPAQFAATVDTFGDGLLRVGLEAGHGESREAWLFMSTWGQPADRIRAVGDAWRHSLRRLLSD